jgi:predicted DsbA family dithiol-disulfide isomerase
MTTSSDHRVSKLYEALSSKEKAAAVFSCLTRLDTTTADRIVATVPMKTYRTLDLDYGDRLSRLSDMATFWGMNYWREMARAFAAMGLMTHAWLRGREDVNEEVFETFEKAQSHVVALEAMLMDLCEENGIDPEAVRTLADVGSAFVPVPLGELPPDPEFESNLRGILSTLAR